ncbi:hypothetical protein pb186bvf_008751 [Paramecium bursaria]
MAQQPIQQQYPFYPPMDNQLRYNPQLSKTEFNPKSILKKAKFCPICDFPITVRVVMQPCQHFMCYECYFIDGKTFCRFCDDIIADYKRLDDKEDFFSFAIYTLSHQQNTKLM